MEIPHRDDAPDGETKLPRNAIPRERWVVRWLLSEPGSERFPNSDQTASTTILRRGPSRRASDSVSCAVWRAPGDRSQEIRILMLVAGGTIEGMPVSVFYWSVSTTLCPSYGPEGACADQGILERSHGQDLPTLQIASLQSLRGQTQAR